MKIAPSKGLIIINNHDCLWMRLSIIWRIMEVEEGVNSFWDLHSFSNDTKAEFNTVFINIVLLFIQNNS